MPKNGRVAEPAFVGVTAARGVITWDPVSVCQYVFAVSVNVLLAIPFHISPKEDR